MYQNYVNPEQALKLLTEFNYGISADAYGDVCLAPIVENPPISNRRELDLISRAVNVHNQQVLVADGMAPGILEYVYGLNANIPSSLWLVVGKQLLASGIFAFSEIRPSERSERAIPQSVIGGVGFLLKGEKKGELEKKIGFEIPNGTCGIMLSPEEFEKLGFVPDWEKLDKNTWIEEQKIILKNVITNQSF